MDSNLAPKRLENCCRHWLHKERELGKLGPHLHNEKRKGDRSQAQQPQPWQQSRPVQTVIVGDYWVIGKVTHLFGKRADEQDEEGG